MNSQTWTFYYENTRGFSQTVELRRHKWGGWQGRITRLSGGWQPLGRLPRTDEETTEWQALREALRSVGREYGEFKTSDWKVTVSV